LSILRKSLDRVERERPEFGRIHSSGAGLAGNFGG
jgi:hypothetical protein